MMGQALPFGHLEADGLHLARLDLEAVDELLDAEPQSGPLAGVQPNRRRDRRPTDRPDHQVHRLRPASLDLDQVHPDVVLGLDQPLIDPAVGQFHAFGGPVVGRGQRVLRHREELGCSGCRQHTPCPQQAGSDA